MDEIRFNPAKKQQTDNCIDAVASSFLFASPKKQQIEKPKKTPNRVKKKSRKWRGV